MKGSFWYLLGRNRTGDWSTPFQNNSTECPHCGKAFVRITDETPLVNRSDGTRFHVALLTGPDLRPAPSGFYDDQAICRFAYAHDQFGPKDQRILVVMTQIMENSKTMRDLIENATDELAALVNQGERLTGVYTFNGTQLSPGFPC